VGCLRRWIDALYNAASVVSSSESMSGVGSSSRGLIPLFLDLNPKLLGLGNLPAKVRDVVEGIREAMDGASSSF
jgi:hypothetical protein